MNIGNNISTLNLNIGTNLSSGVINIGSINKTTNISGAVNIATGTNTSESQVQIGSTTLSTALIKGVNIVMNDITGTKVQIGGKDMDIMYLRGKDVLINDGNSTDYINNGNTVIGNNYGSGYTLLLSNKINIGQFITNGGYIDIGGGATTTASYIVLGSTNLETNYIRGKSVNINTDGTGDVKLCNGTGILYIFSPLRVSYTPSSINSNQHIGYKFSASFFGTQTTYSGGDRAFGWWYVPPGVYVVAYTSVYNRTTTFNKSFIYYTTVAPNNINYFISTAGGGYSEASIVESNNESFGYRRTTGSACIAFNVASYIALSQNFFYPGAPVDNVGYGIDVVRVG